MPTPTYTPLANVTLSSSASSVTFSSIPATYRDLVLVVNHLPSGDGDLRVQFNGDTTGANYPGVAMVGNGSTTSSYTYTGYIAPVGFGTSTNRHNAIFQIMDYSATNKHKSVLTRGDNAANQTGATAGRWANTAAVT